MRVERGRILGIRGVLRVAGLGLALAAAATSVRSGVTPIDNACDPGEGPDLVVEDIPDVRPWTTFQGISSFSLATVSCNTGACWADWIPDTPQHPVIAQNVYRLEDGRFEQIGQSWLKHGFEAANHPTCYPDCLAGDEFHLGVHCSDPYSAWLNGQQLQMGPRSDVNPYTGEFPFPGTDMNLTGGPLYKRLQVHVEDIDPAQNPQALYFAEAQYIHPADARAINNASHRAIEFFPVGSGFYDAALLGETVVRLPAIHAWAAAHPDTVLSEANAPLDGHFTTASRVTELGNGLWHYEYAVHNLNSHRAAGSFTVELPPGASVSNVGFHDVDYHSGEPYDGTDWSSNAGVSGTLRWETQAYTSNPNANALRWGTLYNFRFDADVAPAAGSVTLGLFRPPLPGQPVTLSMDALVPQACDGDGACDAWESCDNCPRDCGECCGDGLCDASESCNCPLDCMPPLTSELHCADGIDGDCDGLTDCTDADCCNDSQCHGADDDGDLYGLCDCDDTNGAAWTVPTEARRLAFEGSTSLRWIPPHAPGAVSVSYEVYRSTKPWNFTTSAVCVDDTDTSDTYCHDADLPRKGVLFCYLVRALNDCPAGQGPLGNGSDDQPRTALACP